MKCLDDGLIILKAPSVTYRSNDVHYAFHQDPNFLYLSGIESPDHIIVLDPKKNKTHVFVPDINPKHLVWHGHLLTKEEAKKKYGFHYGHYLSDFPSVIKKIKGRYRKAYMPKGKSELRKHLPKTIKIDSPSLTKTTTKLRLIKSEDEIKLMSKANNISSSAHLDLMKSISAGQFENNAQAHFEKNCRDNGVKHFAYGTIAAGGRNGATLHYEDNDKPLKKGDLFLIDAGCEWKGYAADITRTYPISGKFNKKQKEIYNVVLKSQKSCIKKARPDISMIDLHILSVKEILNGLNKLGFFKTDDINILMKNLVHMLFYPHGIGHLLGLDVHDVGHSKRSKNKSIRNLRNTLMLKPGMVITIEPGIYFIEAYLKSAKTRKKYNKYVNWKKVMEYYSVGGIRIEDDIVITKSGHKNLTKAPKEISQIEKVMAK